MLFPGRAIQNDPLTIIRSSFIDSTGRGLRQADTEAGPELEEVCGIDGAIIVEVERGRVGAECRAENDEVGHVDPAVAVGVAEEAMECRDEIHARRTRGSGAKELPIEVDHL